MLKRTRLRLIMNRLRTPEVSHHEFLPSAVALEQTPVNGYTRRIIWIIVSLFMFLLIWSYLGKLDIVTIAQGQVIPDGRIKPVQSLVQANISHIHVEEGQSVIKGDLLMALDDADVQAELVRLQQHHQQLIDDEQRQQQMIEWLNNEGDVSLDAINDYLLISEWRLYQEKHQEIEAMQARLKMELQRNQMLAEKHQAILPILKNKEKNLKKLTDKNLSSEQQYLDQMQLRIESEHEMKAALAKVREIDAGLKAIKQKRSLLKQEHLQKYHQEYKASHENRLAIEQELQKQQKKVSHYRLYAPIDGRVEQISVAGLGEVVSPTQELMRIVPSSAALQIESYIQNSDIGFVEQGQKVALKIDAYPFTRYGLIDAELQSISSDAIVNDQGQLVYKCKVKPRQEYLQYEDRQLRIAPGMTVVAEIITGERRLLDFFLSPIQQNLSESARER